MRLARWRSIVLSAPLGLAALGSVSAAPSPDEALLLERIDRGLSGVMWMAKNAEAKLRNDVRDGGDKVRGMAAATPALACCSTNLDRMRGKLDDAVDAIDELKAEIARGETADAEAMDQLSALETQSNTVFVAIKSFETAPNKGEAEAGLKALAGAFLRARETADILLTRRGYERPTSDEKSGRESQ